jgi:hypothetical protein
MESNVKFLINYLTKKIHSGEAPRSLLKRKNNVHGLEKMVNGDGCLAKVVKKNAVRREVYTST